MVCAVGNILCKITENYATNKNLQALHASRLGKRSEYYQLFVSGGRYGAIVVSAMLPGRLGEQDEYATS